MENDPGTQGTARPLVSKVRSLKMVERLEGEPAERTVGGPVPGSIPWPPLSKTERHVDCITFYY